MQFFKLDKKFRYYNIIYEIINNFKKSNYEILSAYIYYINFNELCSFNWSEKFILEISKIRKQDINFDIKFKEFQNYFGNKKGIAKYLNNNEYSQLKSFLYII